MLLHGSNVYLFAFREFLVDLMGVPGYLIPADAPSANEATFNPYNPKVNKIPSLHSSNDSGVAYFRPKTLLGEGSSQNAEVESSSPLDKRSSSEKAESIPPFLPASGDTVVGSSGTSNRPTPDQSDHISSSGIGTSMYKGSRMVPAVGDGVRMNLNVVPYNQNTSEDPKNLFADLNPFQIKGTGKTSVHNKATENKVDELQRLRNNPVSGRPPAPLMWKNRYACNEVPQKKEYDYIEGMFPRINREPNDYYQSSLASTSSAKTGMIYGDGFKSSGNSNASSRDTDGANSASVTSSMLQASKGEFKNRLPLVEDLNANLKGERPRNGEELQSDTTDMVKEHEEHGIGFHDRRKSTHDRYMRTNLKLKNPENPSPSVDSSTNRVDQMLDVGECEIPWEELVIGERIGLGSAYDLFYIFVMFCNHGIIVKFVFFFKEIFHSFYSQKRKREKGKGP
jgi:hypothetical protein